MIFSKFRGYLTALILVFGVQNAFSQVIKAHLPTRLSTKASTKRPYLNTNNAVEYHALLKDDADQTFSNTRRIAFYEDGDKSEKDDQYASSTSLTVGYIADEYNLHTDNGSGKFIFKGNASGLMLNSRSSSLMLSYGTANARENRGDIRSITVDLHVGGNATLFHKFFGLPIGGYIPIRFNMGYRNLHLMDAQESVQKTTANMGSGGLGIGLGANVTIPTGLPLLRDNIKGFVSIVKSVGGMGDLSSVKDNQGLNGKDKTIDGIRLTQNTDFNIEGKFEHLLGNVGVTVGLTLRWFKWTTNPADNFGQIFDVIGGNKKDLKQRGTQSFLRLGINW